MHTLQLLLIFINGIGAQFPKCKPALELTLSFSPYLVGWGASVIFKVTHGRRQCVSREEKATRREKRRPL